MEYPTKQLPIEVEKPDNDATVNAVLDRYEDLKLASKGLDEFFVWPEESRPKIGHEEFDAEIPVIDLAPVLKLRKLRKEGGSGNDDEIRACEAAQAGVEKAIRSACETYGFFQIVNHGFPIELVDQLTECYREIFDLPLEERMKVKEEFIEGKLGKPGYTPITRSTAYTKIDKSHIWNEGFDMESPELLFPDRLEKLSKILYPEGSATSEKGEHLRSCAAQYGKQSSDLTFLLLDLVEASLGLPEKASEELLGCDHDTQILARLRVNHYPVCSHPDKTWGIYNHTDATILTVLHQDVVGGLQVGFRDGSWHGLRPIHEAFVVNVGDFLQAWTNGRFLSAEHRVVANDKSRRFSIAYFALNQNNALIRPRAELVDAEHPLLYKPFTMSEYFETILTKGLGRTRGQVLTRLFGANSED